MISSLIHWLFRSVLLNFHIFVNFQNFLLFFISFYCGQRHSLYDFSPSNLSWLVYWPKVWSILEYAPCALEKNVKSDVFRRNVIQMFIRSNRFTLLLRSFISFLISCLVIYFIYNESDVLISFTVIVEISISPFNSISFCYMYFRDLFWGAYSFIIVIFF